MTQDKSENLALPIILGLVLILGAGALVWFTLPQSKRPQTEPAREAATTAEETTGAEVPLPPVDLEAAIAAVQAGGCTACHTIPGIPGAIGQVGPNLANIGVDAATRREGYDAERYIHESLVEPNAFVAPECPTGPCIAGAMPVTQLDEAQIDVLVNYLRSLGVADAGTAQEEPAGAGEVAEVAKAPPPEPIEPIIEPAAPTEYVTAFNKGGCAGCHSIPGIPGANGLVGPNLSEIGLTAADRVSGTGAEDYLRQSILEPGAFIAPECPQGDCPPGVMLQTFAKSLSEADLATIVSYLSVLGTEAAIPLSTPTEAVASITVALPPESVLEPFTPLPRDPASEAQITLGKYLFFDSRLSNNNALSCASCHQPDKAFTDGEALSQGYPSTKLFRNVPTLYNTAFYEKLYWDGRMDGSDMATLVRDHVTEAHFMSNDGRLMAERLKQVPAYVELFNEAYGSGPGFGGTIRAVASYVQSLNSPASAYDDFLAGDSEALSDEAQAGLALFEGQAGCSSCHSGPLLSDQQFYNTGVTADPDMLADPERHITFRRFFRILGVPNYRNLQEDTGLYALTLDEADWGKFRTASLREVGQTGPYLHNGSLASLEEVVRFYNEGGGESQTAGLEPLGLNDEEVDQLVAFLESLTSEVTPVEAPTLPDYQLMTLGGTTQ